MFVRLASAARARGAGAALGVGCAGAARGAASAGAPQNESPTTRRIGAAVLSGAVLYTGYLAAWQLKRRQWKIDLIESRTASLSAEPQDLGVLWPSSTHTDTLPAHAEYTRATCSGVFDHAAQAQPFRKASASFRTHVALCAFVAHTRQIYT